MNKILMLTAAALTATAAGTSASMAGQAGSAILGLYAGTNCCSDEIVLTWSGNNYADIHRICAISSVMKGMGIAAKTKGIGKNVVMSDSYKGDLSAGFYVGFQFGLPVKSGNPFNAYYTTNGTTITQYLAGWYTLGNPCEKHNGPSTRDALPKKIIGR